MLRTRTIAVGAVTDMRNIVTATVTAIMNETRTGPVREIEVMIVTVTEIATEGAVVNAQHRVIQRTAVTVHTIAEEAEIDHAPIPATEIMIAHEIVLVIDNANATSAIHGANQKAPSLLREHPSKKRSKSSRSRDVPVKKKFLRLDLRPCKLPPAPEPSAFSQLMDTIHLVT